MNHEKNLKQQESVHPIIVWIIASILFHLLLTLGVMMLKLKKLSLDKHTKKQNTEERFILMDEPKKTVPPSAQPQAQIPKTVPAKPEPKKQDEPKLHWSDYTLVPGRKGIDQQNIDNPQDLNNLPTPQNQKQEPKKTEQKRSEPDKKDPAENIEKKEQDVTAQPKQIEKKIEPKVQFDDTGRPINKPQTPSTFQDNVEKTSVPKTKERTPIDEQNPYEYVPALTRTVSFKDLNLGYEERAPHIGNNANLIQRGNSIESPDPIALKHLTYYNQCAGMIKSAFATHPHARLRPYATGKNFHFSVTVNRNGEQIKFHRMQSSGDQVLDNIITEAVKSINMFPQVPHFIPDDPFVMRWIFLH
jgi:hypothetical protein